MHTQRNRILFFGSASAVGFAAMGLNRYMLQYCFDDKGLLIAGNLPGRLLWVLCIGYALALWPMLRTIGGEGSYEDNFPKCKLSGSLMIAAGAVMALSIPGLGLEQMEVVGPWDQLLVRVMAVLPWLAAGSMVVLGLCRMAGRRPNALPGGIVCLFYMLMLVNNYRLWSADPKFHEYAFPVLAGVLLMLSSFHRTSCDVGIIQRKKLLFTGFTGAICAMVSLSGGFLPGYFAASTLWAMGSMCNPAVLPPDPEPEEEEEDAEEEAAEE